MSLKIRLALVVMLLMATLVASYSALLFSEVRNRADAETQGALPWVLALLPDKADPGDAAVARAELVDLMGRLSGIRHVRVSLFDASGHLLAVAPNGKQHVPVWLERELPAAPAIRKDVRQAGLAIAHFEVAPATSDELAELWEDFLHSTLLVVSLSFAAASLIVWSTFKALKPVDRIRSALRAVGTGHPDARLPAFRSPEMNEIAQTFNRMASDIEAAQQERTTLMRRLVESEERTRRSLARDLHDELSPYLVALQPLTRLLESRCAASAELADVAQSVHTLTTYQSRILTTLREILTGLHPPELATLGLSEALNLSLAQRAEIGGRPMQIDLRIEGDLRHCGPTVDVSIYRMVQECVTNAQRHGDGGAMRVTIVAETSAAGRPRWVQIDAVNPCEAPGSATARHGMGVPGMRERSIALGGSFEAGPMAGGWRVRIRLPIEGSHELVEEPA